MLNKRRERGDNECKLSQVYRFTGGKLRLFATESFYFLRQDHMKEEARSYAEFEGRGGEW